MTQAVINFGIRTTLPSLGPRCLFDHSKAWTLVSLCFQHLEAFHTTQVLGVGVTVRPKLGIRFFNIPPTWVGVGVGVTGPGQGLHRQHPVSFPALALPCPGESRLLSCQWQEVRSVCWRIHPGSGEGKGAKVTRKCSRMGWTLTEPSRKINLAILFLSLAQTFHSGELATHFQRWGSFFFFLSFCAFWNGVSGDPGHSKGREDTAATREASRIRAERLTWCLCVVKTMVGKHSDSSVTSLCFKINLNRAVKRVSRLYKCLFMNNSFQTI